MKEQVVFLFFFIVATALHAQSPSWAWEKSFGGHKNDAPGDLITDPEGNIYMSGNFSDSAKFGDIIILESDPYIAQNGFILKISPEGKVLWVKHSDGNPGFLKYSSLTYYNHAIYTTGQYAAGTLSIEGHTLYGKRNKINSFFAKFSTDGELLWIKSIADSNSVDQLDPGSLAVDSSGHLLLEGTYSGTVTIQGHVLQTPGKFVNNFFLARFDSSGALQWIKDGMQHSLSSRSSNAIGGVGICCDQMNNVYFIGNFCDTISFFEFTLRASPDAVNGDFFVAKFDPQGIFLGAYNSNGKTGAHAYSICCEQNGTCTIGGSLSDAIDFGNNVLLEPYSSGELFLVQFDSALKPQWGYNSTAVVNSQSAFSQIDNIHCDGKGNLYFVAEFSGSHIFWGNTESNDQPALITVMLDKKGTFQWLKSSWQRSDLVNSTQNFLLAVGSNQDVYCAGSMVAPYYFGSADSVVPLMAWNGVNVPVSDIFLAKITESSSLVKQYSEQIRLLVNYPNPLTAKNYFTTTIPLWIQEGGAFKLLIFNIFGEQVYSEIMRFDEGGSHSFIFTGKALPSGKYFYQIRSATGDAVLQANFQIIK